MSSLSFVGSKPKIRSASLSASSVIGRRSHRWQQRLWWFQRFRCLLCIFLLLWLSRSSHEIPKSTVFSQSRSKDKKIDWHVLFSIPLFNLSFLSWNPFQFFQFILFYFMLFCWFWFTYNFVNFVLNWDLLDWIDVLGLFASIIIVIWKTA